MENQEKSIYTIDIRDGMPDIKACLRILEYQFASAAAIGERIVKVVHGCGATFRGCGRLREETRHWGKVNKRVGIMIKGENFEPENKLTRYLLGNFPYVANDPDLGKANPEITLFFIMERK